MTSSNTATMTLTTAHLPPRVRHILQAINALAAQSLSASLTATLNELEQQLFQQAERSRSSQHQTDQFVELQLLRRHRSDLIPRYLAGLEHALARIRSASTLEKSKIGASAEPIHFQTLALVDNTDLDRHLVLNEIARRESIRHNNALLLLCQRFGVLSGSPAFDNEQLPVGPYVLCRILSDAGEALQMNLNSQLLLYRMFESQTLSQYGELADQLNTLLSDNGVLPGLVYQPYHRRNASQPTEGKSDKNKMAPHPMTGWSGQFNGSSWGSDLLSTLGIGKPNGNGNGNNGHDHSHAARKRQHAAFESLRELLSKHHGITTGNPAAGSAPSSSPHGEAVASPASALASQGFILPPDTMLNALSTLQPLQPPPTTPGRPRRTLEDVRKAALEHIRETHGHDATIPQEQNDTFELLGMLYNEIGREVRRNAPAQDLLVRLQVPVARAAIADETFFVRDQHPARELLNSVAESGATWLTEDDTDPQLVKKLESAVDQVVKEYDGDEQTFDHANREIQKHYRSQIRRAELTERRQVEAARGRDRLELARRRAAEVIQSQLNGREPPQFVQMLLNLAWTDVLTLTLLRQGMDSEAWRGCEQITADIIRTVFSEKPLADPELQNRIEAALKQVGYHDAEAHSIARHLSSSVAESEPTTETELATRLKSRTQPDGATEVKKAALPPRTPQEQTCYEQLMALPFGTWFEFVLNQQGDVRRQRLSWYSPLTGNTLFVNQRGQRMAEQSLDSVARLMAREQVRVVTEDKSRLIDRAWQATLRTLRNLTGGGASASRPETNA